MNTHRKILDTIRKLMSLDYDHTRCPKCMFIVDVDGNGNMVTHGSGVEPCIGSERNDEELADELDAGVNPEPQVDPIETDGQATH